MIDLSLCLINRNDQKFLVPLIKAARPYVGEIVMVDTGSTDDSVVAALRAGADSIRSMPELMHEDGVIRSFAEARNHSYDLATCSWRLWLDADCTIDHWDQVPKTIEKATQYRDDGHPGLNLRMWIDYTWNEDRTVCCQTFTREFFTHKDDGWVWKRPIHEYLHREAGHLPEVMVDYLRVTHMSQGARNRENGSDRNLTVLKRWEANGGLEEEPEVLHYYLGDEMMSRCMFEEAFVYFDMSVKEAKRPKWADRAALRAGTQLLGTNDINRAEAYIKEQVATRDHVADFGWQLAYVYARRGDRTRATEALLATYDKPQRIQGENTHYRDAVAEWLGIELKPAQEMQP